jgi:dTDP-4-dehydrorhamnose reductase
MESSTQKILVTGSNGQLGSEFRAIASLYPTLNFIFTDIEELNITSPKAVNEFIQREKPDFVINCAAYTAVDKSEVETEVATLLNTIAPGIIANACNTNGCRMIHLSTDYVFDGKACQPYHELSTVNPTSHYGWSKLKGEEKVLDSGIGMVIRTSWLYSSFGQNFVKTIIKNAKIKSELRVVEDQIGCPTYARDLAEAILKIISKGDDSFVPEIFHYSNDGVCSWYDFASQIVKLTNLDCKVVPIETKDYPSPVKRPSYSAFSKEKIKNQYNLEIPSWSNSLHSCISLIMKDGLT